MNDTIGWRYALAYTYGYEHYVISVETDTPNDWAYDEKIQVVFGNDMQNMNDGTIKCTNCAWAAITVKDGKIITNQVYDDEFNGFYSPYDWKTTFSDLGNMKAYPTIETELHSVQHETAFEMCAYLVLPATIFAIIFKGVWKIGRSH